MREVLDTTIAVCACVVRGVQVVYNVKLVYSIVLIATIALGVKRLMYSELLVWRWYTCIAV